MALTRVVYNEAEEQALRRGPIADDAEDRGRRVAQGARRRVSVRTGELLGSIESREAETSGDEVTVDVSADATNAGFAYAIALEFGAVHMPEEPFLIPALEEIE